MVNASKIRKVEQLKGELGKASSIVFARNEGLTVQEISELRKQLRESDAKLTIVKNTLAKIVLKDLELEEKEGFFEGPTGVVYTEGDPVVPARVVMDFGKKVKKIKIQGGVIGKDSLGGADMEKVALLPSKPELVAKLLYLMKWPLQGLVNVLTGPSRSFLYCLNAIKAQKEEGGK